MNLRRAFPLNRGLAQAMLFVIMTLGSVTTDWVSSDMAVMEKGSNMESLLRNEEFWASAWI